MLFDQVKKHPTKKPIKNKKAKQKNTTEREWCVWMCVCILDRDRYSVFASRALVVLTAMYLTSYSIFPTSFCEPLSQPY